MLNPPGIQPVPNSDAHEGDEEDLPVMDVDPDRHGHAHEEEDEDELQKEAEHTVSELAQPYGAELLGAEYATDLAMCATQLRG
jgi:hypothetical protein